VTSGTVWQGHEGEDGGGDSTDRMEEVKGSPRKVWGYTSIFGAETGNRTVKERGEARGPKKQGGEKEGGVQSRRQL